MNKKFNSKQRIIIKELEANDLKKENFLSYLCLSEYFSNLKDWPGKINLRKATTQMTNKVIDDVIKLDYIKLKDDYYYYKIKSDLVSRKEFKCKMDEYTNNFEIIEWEENVTMLEEIAASQAMRKVIESR